MAFKKMNPELKAKWLRALRGGRYKQAQNSLKRDVYTDGYLNDKTETQYCCLGVLCNVSKQGKWKGNVFQVNERSYSDNYIPKSLLPKVGITDKTQKFLARMNDNKGMSFKEIANWVEANL